LKHFLSESLKTGLYQKEQLKNLSNRPNLIPSRKAKSQKISPSFEEPVPRIREGAGGGYVQKKPNQKSNKTLLTAKKLSKTTHVLSITHNLFKKPTVKHC